jgi:hypothetical protein
VLVIVLMLSIAALALGLLSATSARTELRIAHNDVLDLQAFNVAEAGMNQALKLIGNHAVFNDELANNGTGTCTGNGVGNTSSGLASIGSATTLASDSQCYRFASFGGSATDGYYVRVEDNYDETSGGDVPTSDSDGTIYIISHGVVGTAERIISGTASLTGWGIFGINSVNLSGGSSTCGGTGPPCSASTSRVGSNGTIALSAGTTVIRGSAFSGTTVTTSGGASVTGTTTNHYATQTFAAVTACGPPYSSATGITMGSGGTYTASTGVFNQPGGHTATLAPGTYCFSSVTLSGGSTLAISGATTVNVTGNWDSSGGSISNTTNDPNNFNLNSSSNCTGSTCVVLSGGSSAYMKLYAPTADVTISGASTFYGSFIGKSLTASGGSTFYQAGVGGAKLTNWHEVQN